MARTVFALAALLPLYTWASPARGARLHGDCKQLNVSISAASNGYVFDIPKVNNDIEATTWALNFDTWSNKPDPEPILKNTSISGTYSIHTQICVPKSGGDVLQIATHGAYYDGRYWDAELEGHSYVDAALQAGYSILTYDRLGTGQSEKPDAYTVVQAQFELEILRELTMMSRSGVFGVQPKSIVHVGHSFGSIVTSAFIATYPSMSDGAIITGYVLNEHLGEVGRSSWNVKFASDWPSGYVVMQKSGIHSTFFGGDFTPEMLDYGDMIKSPTAVAEIASGGLLVRASGPFTGPIHYILPELDFFICAGDCKGVTSLEFLKHTFPNSSSIQLDIQPNTGHALPLHNNATEGFQLSFDFLNKNGL